MCYANERITFRHLHGPSPIAEWSTALPLTARCLLCATPMREEKYVSFVITFRRCQWPSPIAKWSTALRCRYFTCCGNEGGRVCWICSYLNLSSLTKAFPDSWVVVYVLRQWRRKSMLGVLTFRHFQRPFLIADCSTALPLTASFYQCRNGDKISVAPVYSGKISSLQIHQFILYGTCKDWYLLSTSDDVYTL